MKKHILKRCLMVVLLSVCPLLAAPSFTNHLRDETSPYLRQHMHNPVDWYPWSNAAFDKARREHKPILLSIGYSTCHWCHVMAETSFSDLEIAASINRYFVPVKVDREVMPDLDYRFQRLYSLVHGRNGGWPLTVLLTESQKPFYVATYIPSDDAYGIEGLRTLIPKFGRAYQTKRTAIEREATRISRMLDDSAPTVHRRFEAGREVMAQALLQTVNRYDRMCKGFGKRPKFPQVSRLHLLLDIAQLEANATAASMVYDTLEAMANGGLYDQVEGGFFRYSTDRCWNLPHFEKMLYTNAELIGLYVRAWRKTHRRRFAEIVRETIMQMQQRFRTTTGMFYSASSADSDGKEGQYYLYEFDAAFSKLRAAGFTFAEAHQILTYLAIEEVGNFDGDLSHVRRMSEAPPPRLNVALKVLRSMRAQRTYPFIDRKIITAWNAMMIVALFDAAAIDPLYAREAVRAYRALKATMQAADGTLYHQTLDGVRPKQPGLLEDYAFFIRAALWAYQFTLQDTYLDDAVRWSTVALKRFDDHGRWKMGTGAMTAEADFSDRHYTSALSVMLGILFDLTVLQSTLTYERAAVETFDTHADTLLRTPAAFPEALRVWLRYRRGIVAVKSNRRNLTGVAEAIAALRYPYVLKEAESDLNGFIACDNRSCFAVSDTFEDIAKRIEAR